MALSGTGVVSSSKPDIDVVDTQANALTSLDLGDTIVDRTGSSSFLIKNLGASSLTVTAATITGSDAFVLTQTNAANNTSDNYTVTAAGQRAIQVNFSPTTAAAETATLTLTTNDPDEPTVAIALTGNGVAPELVVDLTPDDTAVANALVPTVTFGSQVDDGTGGQRGEYDINIANPGLTTLTISSITFGQQAGYFSIEGNGIDLNGFTVAPGASIPATIVFDPAVAASAPDALAQETDLADQITITSDDLDSPVMRFSLSGQAVEAYTATIEAGASMTFTDSDGDIAEIALAGSGTATVVFDAGGLDSANIATVTVTGASASARLTISVTDAQGDGTLDVGTIDIDSAFGNISIEGNLQSLDIEGSIKLINVTSTLDALDVDGAVTTLTAGALGDATGSTTTLAADSFGKMTIEGNVANVQITTDVTNTTGIKALSVDGTMDDVTIETSALKKLTVDAAVSDTAIDVTNAESGTVGTVKLNAGATGFDIIADVLSKLTVTGNLTDSTLDISTGLAKAGTVKVTGNAEIDLTADSLNGITTTGNLAGSVTVTGTKGIKKLAAGGDLSADLTAAILGKITAGGSITSAQITAQNAGAATLKSLIAGSDVNVTNLNIDGTIKKIQAGKSDDDASISGSITAGTTLSAITATGDINATIAAGTYIGTIQTGGSLTSTADITCTVGDINRILVANRITSQITANGGLGTIGSIPYDANTFRNILGQADMPSAHINANWTAS